MAGRRVVWVLSLPAAAAGWLSAHAAAYALVAPDGDHRASLLAESGHGYLGLAPVFLACAATLVVAALGLAIDDGLRGRSRVHIPVWPVALVPPLGFALQEHLERLIELNAFPYGAALEPTFLVGMALQAPFALGAVLLARAVLAIGHRVGRGLAALRSLRARARPAAPVPYPWRAPELARPSLLATGHCERAPPAPAVA